MDESGGRCAAASRMRRVRRKTTALRKTYMSELSGRHASDQVLDDGAQSYGGQVQSADSKKDGCTQNSWSRERYAYAAALFVYREEGDYRKIPYQIKYHGNIPLGRYFGSMLGQRLQESELFKNVDLVMPVPLHWMRKWKRGYNQAEVLAGAVADILGAEMDVSTLSRHRRTSTQTKLGVEEKAVNVKGAFKVCNVSAGNKRCPEMKIELASVRHILLIDDVFTTGSTLGECFRALRSVFPPSSVRISVVTLAFVGH